MVDDPFSVITTIVTSVGALLVYMVKRLNERLNNMESDLETKVNDSDMHDYVNEKHKSLIRDIDDKRDRIRALEIKLDRIMELLLEIKNGKN